MTEQSILEQSLEYLNDDPRVLYALSFNATLGAWNVVKLQRVQQGSDLRYGEHVNITPVANNHTTLASALKDAVVLKSAGK